MWGGYVGWGERVVVELAMSSDGFFFKYICYRHSSHTDISNAGGHLACGLILSKKIKPELLKQPLFATVKKYKSSLVNKIYFIIVDNITFICFIYALKSLLRIK